MTNTPLPRGARLAAALAERRAQLEADPQQYFPNATPEQRARYLRFARALTDLKMAKEGATAPDHGVNAYAGGNNPVHSRSSVGTKKGLDRGYRRRGEVLSMLGEWHNYNRYVRENDKLSNAEKAEDARRYADNFEIKGWDWYALEARQDAEKFQRAADDEARQRRLQRSRETEERRRRYERTCPSCHRKEPEGDPLTPPWRRPKTRDVQD